MGEIEEPMAKRMKTEGTNTKDNIDTLTISRICAKCRLDFLDEQHLRSHFLRFKHQSSFQCELCHKSYQRADILQEHQRVHLCESLYKCVKCFYSCNQIYDIYEHMHSIHRITIEHIFKCPYDDMMFRDKDTLFHHIECHRIKDPSARQKDSNEAAEESAKETEETEIEDPLNLDSFQSPPKKETDDSEDVNEEDDVLPSTLLQCNLDTMIGRAHQVLPMVGRALTLSQEENLEPQETEELKTADVKKEAVETTGEKGVEVEDEVLDEIDKSTLIDLDYVKNDMVINTENLHSNMNLETDSSIRMLAYFKNIKCAYCTKMFVMKNDLKNHLVLDHDLSKSVLSDDQTIEEKFECSLCKIKFDFAIDLTHHNMKEHTEFKCATCKKVYHQAHNLRKHEKVCAAAVPKEKAARVTKPAVIMCEICDKIFKRNWNLKQHLTKVHKILPPT